MKNQRFTVHTTEEEGHIYLKPNMPEKEVNDELTKKFGNQWLYADYNTNQILNPMTMHKFGGLTDSLKKASVTVKKSAEDAYDLTKPRVVRAAKSAKATITPVVKSASGTIFRATKNAGQYAWDAAEEVAPDIYEAGKKAGKTLAKEAADFFTDIFNYGLTKSEQYQKYKLLQTAQAKREFNDIMRKFKAGLLKKNGVEVTEFRKALKMAVEKSFDTDEKQLRKLAKAERGMMIPNAEFNKFEMPDVEAYHYALHIKNTYPKIWKIGRNEFDDVAFNNLGRVIKRGFWLDKEEPFYKKWKSSMDRKAGNKTLAGKIALLKWLSWGNTGRDKTEELIDNAISKLYNHKYARGGEIIDLAPLSEVPLSTQFQRLTGDSYNVEDFENEAGGGLQAYPGNVIVHKKTGKKFRIPLPEKIVENGSGGFNYPSAGERVAKEVDLITLPKNVQGTNCGNCSFARPLDKSTGRYQCINPKINLMVTDRMCCALWDNKGAIRQWQKFEEGGPVPYDPFEEKKEWERIKRFIAGVLSNDETSTDEELVNYFMKETGMSEDEAEFYVDQRDTFLNKSASPADLVKYETEEITDQEPETTVEDVLIGGLGDNLPDSAIDPEKLEKGIKVEMEHTNDPEIAKEIAKDHYAEFPPTPTKDYYEELELMEEKLKEPEVITITDEDAEFPTNEQAQATFDTVPEGEDFYLNGKDVDKWDADDLQNYVNFKREFAKAQYQQLYDQADTQEDQEGFVNFVQKTKNDFLHDDLIVVALIPCKSFTEVTKVLAKTGYLVPTQKYRTGGITIEQVDSSKPKLTKLYMLTGEYDGGYFATTFRIQFAPVMEPSVSKSTSKYRFNYKPESYQIESITNRDGAILKHVHPEILEEINRDIEYFRITKADASEWKQYKEGGKVDRYTFEEKKKIGAEILKQIGMATLMRIGAHNYGVGENDKGFPYIQFKASGAAHKRGLYITVYYNPRDWYIVEGVTLINYVRKEVGRYDMVYNNQLSDIVLQIADGVKYAKGGNVRINEMVKNWQKEGRAFSNISNNDNEFFEKIGIPLSSIGTTSQTGNDLVYYDTKKYSSGKNALKLVKMAVGGLTEGPSHKEGGIPMTVKSTGQKVELEGGEQIINTKNTASKKRYIITKPLTPKQIGSCINELDGNGVKYRDENSPCPIVEVDKNVTQ